MDQDPNIQKRVKVAQFLNNAIKRKLLFDTKWLTKALDDVEVGRLSPIGAMHAFSRMQARQNMRSLLQSENFLLKDAQEILNCPGTPPCPKQCRMGIRAAWCGGIVTLFGPSGTGKTTCAIRAAAYLAATSGCETIVAVCGTMIGRMRPADLYELIECALEARVLVLDDLDKGSKSETRSSAILEILDGRERDHHRTTIITCNKSGAELAEQIERQTEGYGLPIVNRIRRGLAVDFGLKDIDEAAAMEAIRSASVKRISDKDEREWAAESFGKLDWRPKI